MKPACLTIGGFDPSAGAGILADLETFTRLGAHGQAVITAVTAQNRTKVRAVHPLSASKIREQAEALFEDGLPDAIKIGMLGSAAAVRQVARLLKQHPDIPVVLDPVFKATAGAALLAPDAFDLLKKSLIPLATVITPNLQEAGRLLNRRIRNRQQSLKAAVDLMDLGPQAVVITGGHLKGAPVDILADPRGTTQMTGQRINPKATRGTGCRHSSALAAHLAHGRKPRQAARLAHSYLRRYLSQGYQK